jgi:hypothetical protein
VRRATYLVVAWCGGGASLPRRPDGKLSMTSNYFDRLESADELDVVV